MKPQTLDDGIQLFTFDAVSHYITSISARKTADITLVFETDSAFVPRFLQIRGTRLDMPVIDPNAITSEHSSRYRGEPISVEDILANRPVMGYPIDTLIDVTQRLGRLTLSLNGLPSSISLDGNYFTEGKLIKKWVNPGVRGKLRVKGVKQDQGSKIVQIDVSLNTNASIFNLLPAVGPNAEIALLDNDRNKYWPIGYYVDADKKMDLTLSPRSPIHTIGELPQIPTSGVKRMVLIFQVTEGQTVVELLLGDIVVGTCDVYIPKRSDSF